MPKDANGRTLKIGDYVTSAEPDKWGRKVYRVRAIGRGKYSNQIRTATAHFEDAKRWRYVPEHLLETGPNGFKVLSKAASAPDFEWSAVERFFGIRLPSMRG